MESIVTKLLYKNFQSKRTIINVLISRSSPNSHYIGYILHIDAVIVN